MHASVCYSYCIYTPCLDFLIFNRNAQKQRFLTMNLTLPPVKNRILSISFWRETSFKPYVNPRVLPQPSISAGAIFRLIMWKSVQSSTWNFYLAFNSNSRSTSISSAGEFSLAGQSQNLKRNTIALMQNPLVTQVFTQFPSTCLHFRVVFTCLLWICFGLYIIFIECLFKVLSGNLHTYVFIVLYISIALFLPFELCILCYRSWKQ